MTAGRGFWLPWVAASTVGGLFALSFGDFPSGVGMLTRGTDMSDESGWAEGWAVLVAGLLAGAIFGAAQWLVLRGRLNGLGWWVPVTVLGWTAAYLVVWAIGGGGGSAAYGHHALPHVLDTGGTLGALIVGLAAGVPQWLVLRHLGSRAIWWVPASVAGLLLGWLAAVATPFHGPEAHLVGGAAFGLLFGIVTAPVLLKLFPGIAAPAFAVRGASAARA